MNIENRSELKTKEKLRLAQHLLLIDVFPNQNATGSVIFCQHSLSISLIHDQSIFRSPEVKGDALDMETVFS